MLDVRLLTSADGAAYQTLRLQSLEQSPQVFVSTYESEKDLETEQFANHLDWAYHPPYFGYFGAFDHGHLIGYLQLGKTYNEKQKHIASLSNLYVLPEYRGKGVASQLFTHIFDVCKTNDVLERLYMTCVATNKNALRLYKKLGFQRYAVKVRAIKWEEQYDDEVELVKVLK